MVSLAMDAIQPRRQAGRDEALWLLRLLRRAPLTLLLSDAGGSADPFIVDRVLPLTARRSVDCTTVPAVDAGAAKRSPLHAGLGADSARVPELVLRFDASFHAEPAAALRQAWWSLWPGGPRPLPGDTPPPGSLWKTASVLHAASGARVLLVLEGLAEWLLPRNDEPGPRQALLDELSGLLVDAGTHAHALLVLDHWTEPLLDKLWRRLPGLSRQLLLLDATRTPPASVPEWIGVAPVAAPAAGRVPPPSRAQALHAEPAPTLLPHAPHAERAGAPRPAPPAFFAACLLASCVTVAAFVWFGARATGSKPVAAAPSASGRVIESAPVREPGDVSDPLSPLARLFAANALPFAAALGEADVTETLAAAARGALVVVRYDVLETSATQRLIALQLLAPLYAQALHFVVRDDSPLQAVHEIESAARVNVGPAGGARAATAAAAWSALFGSRWNTGQADAAASALALPRLLAGEVDVVVLLGDEWAREWLAVPAPQRRSLRLLPLDARDPSSARAQRRFLPATLAADPLRANAALPGLAAMTFLATGADAGVASVVRAAQSVCAALPGLQRDGGPTWQTVRPALTLPAPWPYAPSAVEVFEHCDAPPMAPSGASSQAPQLSPPADERKAS